MRPTRISGADPKPLAAPADWNEAEAGPCGALFIRRERHDGVDYMRSAWEVDAGEAAPDQFPEFDEDIPTQHRCPKCNYEWSGKAS